MREHLRGRGRDRGVPAFLTANAAQNKTHDVVVDDVDRHAGLRCKRGTRSWLGRGMHGYWSTWPTCLLEYSAYWSTLTTWPTRVRSRPTENLESLAHWVPCSTCLLEYSKYARDSKYASARPARVLGLLTHESFCICQRRNSNLHTASPLQ